MSDTTNASGDALHETQRCVGCHAILGHDPAGPPSWACDRCTDRYGPVLIKAAGDHFDYAVRLVSGEIIRFHDASLHGEWVTLSDIDRAGSTLPDVLSIPERGLDVRLSHITWASDAPGGS